MDNVDIKTYMQMVGREARAASHTMAKADSSSKNKALTEIASSIRKNEKNLLAANKDDLEAAKAQGLDSALIDRLTLTSEGVTNMVEGLLQIASLADPVGEISDLNYRPSGIRSGKCGCR